MVIPGNVEWGGGITIREDAGQSHGFHMASTSAQHNPKHRMEAGSYNAAGGREPGRPNRRLTGGVDTAATFGEMDLREGKIEATIIMRKGLARSCNLCRQSHTACEAYFSSLPEKTRHISPCTYFYIYFEKNDLNPMHSRSRPCPRCVRIGKAHLCANIPLRKRGRPKSNQRDAASSRTFPPIEPKRHLHHTRDPPTDSPRGPAPSPAAHPPPPAPGEAENRKRPTSELSGAADPTTTVRLLPTVRLLSVPPGRAAPPRILPVAISSPPSMTGASYQSSSACAAHCASGHNHYQQHQTRTKPLSACTYMHARTLFLHNSAPSPSHAGRSVFQIFPQQTLISHDFHHHHHLPLNTTGKQKRATPIASSPLLGGLHQWNVLSRPHSLSPLPPPPTLGNVKRFKLIAIVSSHDGRGS